MGICGILLTIEFPTGTYKRVNIFLHCFSPSSWQLWQFYFGWIYLVVSGLYSAWLAFIKCVSSKGMDDSQAFLGFPGDGQKSKTTSEITAPLSSSLQTILPFPSSSLIICPC